MKSKINITIPGSKNKGKCWAKKVTGIDFNQKDGYMFQGEFLHEGETMLEDGAVILYVGYFGSWKNGKQEAGITQVIEGEEVVIVDQNVSWKKNKVSLAEKCLELLNSKNL